MAASSLEERPLNRISFKAVALGVLVVVLLDISVSITLTWLWGGDVFVGDPSAEQASTLEAIRDSTGFLWASIVLGTCTTVVGGYVTARMSKRFPYFNGLAFGIAGTLLGVLFWSENPLWLNLLGLVSAVPAALLGTHLACARNPRP